MISSKLVSQRPKTAPTGPEEMGTKKIDHFVKIDGIINYYDLNL